MSMNAGPNSSPKFWLCPKENEASYIHFLAVKLPLQNNGFQVNFSKSKT